MTAGQAHVPKAKPNHNSEKIQEIWPAQDGNKEIA
jgi:hypothetical protein